jgi:hypothetical protein
MIVGIENEKKSQSLKVSVQITLKEIEMMVVSLVRRRRMEDRQRLKEEGRMMNQKRKSRKMKNKTKRKKNLPLQQAKKMAKKMRRARNQRTKEISLRNVELK